MDCITTIVIGVKVFVKGVIFACGAFTGKWIYERYVEEEEEEEALME